MNIMEIAYSYAVNRLQIFKQFGTSLLYTDDTSCIHLKVSMFMKIQPSSLISFINSFSMHTSFDK